MAATVTSQMRSAGEMAMIIRPRAEPFLRQKVNRIAEVAKARAPVSREPDSGRLKRSIRVVARDTGGRFASLDSATVASVAITVNVPYASYVIRGTKPHIIRSLGPWPLRNRVTGQVFGPIVRHPGQKPNNFLAVALRSAGGFRG